MKFENFQKAHEPLMAPVVISEGRALYYLKERFCLGSLEEALAFARTYELGFEENLSAIAIPVRDFDGELLGIKYDRRVLDREAHPKYSSAPGSKAGLFVVPGALLESQMLIVEGEWDALSAQRLGFMGLIVATQTNRIPKDAEEAIKKKASSCEKVFLMPDNDEAGEELVESLKRLLPEALVVRLPESFKDVSELLQSGEQAPQVLMGLLSEAKSEMEKISFDALARIEETMQFLENPLNVNGWSTGFQLLDERLGGGLLPYMLTAVCAPGKTGKTTFLLQLIYNLIKSELKVGFLSLEMNPITHIIPSLLSIASGTNIRRMENEKRRQVVALTIEDKPFLKNLHFMDRYGITPSDLIESWIKEQHLKHGVNVFCLDHVGYSIKDIKDVNEHSQLSKRLRSLTRSYPIHIIAIIQPKNLSFGQTKITKNDLYGSVTYAQDINQLITLERQEGATLVRLTDSHNPLARPSDTEAISLIYDHETCSLS